MHVIKYQQSGIFFTNGEDVYIQFNEGMTRIESLDWETLKSMLGDNLITLNKDK